MERGARTIGKGNPSARASLPALGHRTPSTERPCRTTPAGLRESTSADSNLRSCRPRAKTFRSTGRTAPPRKGRRSEEHTSELQSQFHLVCRLLLEKKKKKTTT